MKITTEAPGSAVAEGTEPYGLTVISCELNIGTTGVALCAHLSPLRAFRAEGPAHTRLGSAPGGGWLYGVRAEGAIHARNINHLP